LTKGDSKRNEHWRKGIHKPCYSTYLRKVR
jgi:hypothetical protein